MMSRLVVAIDLVTLLLLQELAVAYAKILPPWL